MNRIGRLYGTNVMAFPTLDINFNQKGLNLIIGKNLDDVKGNDSRNGVGKSSLFKILEAHLFPGQGGVKVSEIVTDTVNKDYLSVCEWEPSNSFPHFSYQYYKHNLWGGGTNIYQGGTYEQFEDNAEGVIDVSHDDSRDAARSISEMMRLSYDEWTLLTSLLDVGNDDIHPFFCSNRTGRLELVQNLYGLNYSMINFQNKEEMKVVKKEHERLGVSIQAQLSTIEDQLKPLPIREELEIVVAVQGKAVTKLDKQLTTASSNLDRIKEMRSTWDRYNELNSKMTTAGIGLRDVQAELDASRATIDSHQLQLNELGIKRTALSLYLDKKRQTAELEEQLNRAAGGADTSNIDAKVVELAAAETDARTMLQLVATVRADLDKIKPELSPIDPIDVALAAVLEKIQAELAALPPVDTLRDEVTRIHLEYTNAEGYVKAGQELQAVLDKLTEVGYAEYANYFTSAEHLQGLILQVKTAQATLPLTLQTWSGEALTIQSALDGTTVCPTCKQSVCTHTPEELEAFRERQPVVQSEIERLQAEVTKAQTDLGAMEYLANILFARPGMLYWQWRSGEFVPSDYDLNAINERLAEAQLAYNTANDVAHKVGNRLTAVQNILTTVPADKLAGLEHGHPYYTEKLRAASDQISNLRSVKVIAQQLEQSRAELATAAADTYVELANDPEAMLVETAKQISQMQTELTQQQQFVKGLQPYLSEWLEYKSERFTNIQQLAATMATQDEAGLHKTHSELSQQITAAREAHSTAANQLAQRNDLELRRDTIQAQATEVNALESRLRVQKAIDLLSGPRGLMVDRTTALFQRINLLLNQYLSVLIQDGVTKGRPLTAWLEMSNNSVDLNVYKGDTFKSKKLISKSENARVKLALTLAMREVAPKNKLTNILLLDEIDGSSCETNSSRIWDCIQMYLERNPETAIWAVSHSTSVQQSGVWNNVYEIVKQNGEASIRLLD